MDIKGLREMNEAERILWFAKATSNDLTIVLENEGIKGISKMKKLQKLEIIVGMVVENTVEDEKIEKVIDDTKKLCEEINARQSFKEEFEVTLYARLAAKEITWEEFKQTIIKYNISIPINVTDEEDTKDILNRNYDMDSMYEHYDRDNKYYYSVLNKDFQWSNVFRNNGKYIYDDWVEKQMYERNTVDEDLIHQLAFDFDDDGGYLLVYKNYELLGYYRDGNINDIKRLVAYDDRLDDDDLENYRKLLGLLDKQYEEYWRIMEADMMLRKKLVIPCNYTNFSFFVKENSKRV